MNRIMITIILLSLFLTIQTSENENIKIKIMTGTYFQKIDTKTITYEKTFPLYYKQNFEMNSEIYSKMLKKGNPKMELFYSQQETKAEDYIERMMNQLNEFFLNNTKTKIFDLQTEFKNEREKRYIQFLGDWFHFCCGVVSEKHIYPLFSNMESITKQYEKIKEAVIDEHKEFIGIASELNNISQTINENFDQFQKLNEESLKNINLRIITYLQTTVYLQTYEDMLNNCRLQHLSHTFLPIQTLQNDLNKLREKLQKLNLTTAIPADQTLQYYSLPLAHCSVSKKEIEIEVKIPLKTIDTDWNIYKNIPIHFKFQEEICILHSEAALLAYETNSRTTKVIAGVSLAGCTETSPLCHIQDFEDTDINPKCLKALFQHETLETLQNLCRFSCQKHIHGMIIKKIGQNHYIITGPEETLKLQYKNGTQITLDINYKSEGALEVKVPCTNQLIQEENSLKKILIPFGFPCSKFTEKDIKILRIIPLQWTNYSNLLLGTEHDPYFINMNKTLHRDWKKITNTFSPRISEEELEKKLTNFTLEKLPKSIYGEAFFGDIIYLALFALNFICLVLIGYLAIKNYFANMHIQANLTALKLLKD